MASLRVRPASCHRVKCRPSSAVTRRSAALAIPCARPENRHKIKGLLISGVIACVVGGTTRPYQFLFLFVAPVLYLIHAGADRSGLYRDGGAGRHHR